MSFVFLIEIVLIQDVVQAVRWYLSGASSRMKVPKFHKEGWAPKIRCFWTVILEKTLESPLDSQEIKPVNPKGNQPWIFIRRTDAEAPIWSPDWKSWLTGKDPDAGKDWGQEKGVTEHEIVGWYHKLNGHKSEKTLGDSGGQRKPACHSPWGCTDGHDLANNNQVPRHHTLQHWSSPPALAHLPSSIEKIKEIFGKIKKTIVLIQNYFLTFATHHC